MKSNLKKLFAGNPAREIDLTTGPLSAHIRRLAVPASIGFFFNTMYNIVDTYFGGRISTRALAALSLSFPVFFLITAFGSGFSTGATACIGTALGKKDREKARYLGIQGLSFGVCLSVLITGGGYFLSPALFRLLGAEAGYLQDALEYMRTVFYGTVFFIVNHMLNAVLQSHGDTRSYRNFLFGGFILNVGLDPWFIYGGFGLPAMGIRGVALATVIIQAAGTVYLSFRVKRGGMFRPKALRLKEFVPSKDAFREIAGQGFPASVNLLTIAAGIFVITYFISRFGQEAVAAYGAGVRIEQIVLVSSIGLNVAVLTISAQNNGAGRHDRIVETVNKALIYGAVIMAAGGALVFALAPYLIRIFTNDPEVAAIGAKYLRIDSLVLYAYVVLFVHVAALQGMKKPIFALIIGVYRQLAAPAAVFYLLAVRAGMGADGVWWGILTVTWSAAILAVIYARVRLRSVRREAA